MGVPKKRKSIVPIKEQKKKPHGFEKVFWNTPRREVAETRKGWLDLDLDQMLVLVR
jgi:hypothetical protein